MNNGWMLFLSPQFTDAYKERYGTNPSTEEENGRLIQHVEDLDTISEERVKELCSGSNAFFCCLGTTRRQAGSAQAFFHIDCEIPARLAQIARDSGVSFASLVTSTGANPNSWFLYLRTKGEIEERLKNMGYNHVSIWRPGLLDRGEENRRFVEKMGMVFARAMPVEDVAKAMLQDALDRIGKAPVTTTEIGGEEVGTPAAKATVFANADIWRVCGQSTL